MAAVLAAGLQDWVDFGVICGLLILNAVVGFGQEYQAGNIVDELKKTMALSATVRRNGVDVELDASEVVPGDILFIEEVSIMKEAEMETPANKCREQSSQPMAVS